MKRARRSGIPASWAELLSRLAYVLGGTGEQFTAEAHEWARQAVEALYGVPTLASLNNTQRHVAFQRCAGALLALEDDPHNLPFTVGLRVIVQDVFARYLNGARPAGPPWRLDPYETSRQPWTPNAEDDFS